jgi:hypothetical protein
MRALAAYLRLGLRAGIYARGGFGFGEPVVGLSDIDLVAVVGGGDDARAWSRVVTRWRRLARMLPWLRRVVDVEIYHEPELEQGRWTRFTYGLDGRWPQSLWFPDSPRSWRRPKRGSLPLALPDLWPVDSWRLISGPDLRPRINSTGPAQSHLLAWVHLQHWCALGLRVLAEPAAPWVTYACVKLVAEPAKILLWLEHAERHFGRREILQRAIEVLPEEEPTLAVALSVLDDLGSARTAPIETVWPCFVRLSARVAQRLTADLQSSGATAVRLEGVASTERANGKPELLPLGDWTALVHPASREESFEVGSGSAADVPAVLAAAGASTPARLVTLLHDAVILRPCRVGRAGFRSIEFGASDPVSSALLRRGTIATFSNAAGWRASDIAARAVAEHGAWLQLPRNPIDTRTEVVTAHLAGVFSAARAGLFLHSLQSDDPMLPVTFEATTTALAERLPRHRVAIEDAYDNYRAAVSGGREVRREVLRAATGALEGLGCYPSPFPHLWPRQPRPRAGALV